MPRRRSHLDGFISFFARRRVSFGVVGQLPLACPSARIHRRRRTHTHIHTPPLQHPHRPDHAVEERAARSFPGASARSHFSLPFVESHHAGTRRAAGSGQFYATYPRAPTPPSPCSCSSDPAAAACGGGHCSRRPRCCWRRWRRGQQPRWRRPSSSLGLLRVAQGRGHGRAPRRSHQAAGAAVSGARRARRCLRRSAGGSRTGALWCSYVCLRVDSEFGRWCSSISIYT